VQLTDYPDMETDPQTDNGRVFFEMFDGEHTSVFMIDLAERLEKPSSGRK